MKFRRYHLIIIFFFLFSAAIAGRLFDIQVKNYQKWRAFAQGQQSRYENNFAERGKIFFSNSSFPVALNRDSAYVFLTPAEIKEQDSAVQFLSVVLGLSESEIMEKLGQRDNLFAVLKENLNETEIEKIKEGNLKGVYLGKERKRYYPQAGLGSRLLGFVDADGKGQYGLEGYYDNVLGSEEDLILTIDYNVQFMAEKLLQQAKENLDIEAGQIIVLDPNTGKIIALADFPNFDPNNYSEYAKKGELDIFQNSATQKVFEPGSVFKPITMAIGLEKEVIAPQTTYIDQGFVKFGGSTVYNYDGRKYGQRTMTEVLEKSINTGAVFVEGLISHDVFLDYLGKFGFFEKSGIDLNEVYSENRELKKGYEINFATASFGQGIEMTPIQLVRAFSSLINGGKMIKPYIVDRENTPESPDFIISPKTSSQIAVMLVSAVENGFGKAARIPGYYIGGKTGTAQVPYSALGINKSGYSDKTVQSFVGFGPAFNPQFIILVKLNNPKAKTAEYSAIPIFRELAGYIINLWQIAPDYE